MKCPECDGATKVTETRIKRDYVPSFYGFQITERSRQCVHCDHRWTTMDFPVGRLKFRQRKMLARIVAPIAAAIPEPEE